MDTGMIDLTKSKDAVRVLENACKPGINQRGTWIAYAEGNYADLVGATPIGVKARELEKQGRVHLFQKRIQDEPRSYVYFAVVR